jgi:MFS family permease
MTFAPPTTITHTGRTLDPFYRNHQLFFLIITVMGVFHGLWTLVSGGGFLTAVWAGFSAGLTGGLAWALARELDPDSERSALVSAAIGGALGVVFPALFPLAALLVLARVVNRITGLSALPSDTVVALGVTALAAYFGHWSLAAVGAGVFLLDALLVDPLLRHRWAALTSGGLAMVVLLWRGNGPSPSLEGVGFGVALLVIVAFTWFLLSRREMTTPADDGSELYLERVQAGMAQAVLVGMLALLTGGAAAVFPYAALWAAMAGPVLWDVWGKIRG